MEKFIAKVKKIPKSIAQYKNIFLSQRNRATFEIEHVLYAAKTDEVFLRVLMVGTQYHTKYKLSTIIGDKDKFKYFSGRDIEYLKNLQEKFEDGLDAWFGDLKSKIIAKNYNANQDCSFYIEISMRDYSELCELTPDEIIDNVELLESFTKHDVFNIAYGSAENRLRNKEMVYADM